MSELELNRHNDATGILQSLAESQKSNFLGDTNMIDRMLRQFAGDMLKRFQSVGDGISTPAEASAADLAECIRLGGIFHGDDPSFTPMAGWTGSNLASYIRHSMEGVVNPNYDDAHVIAQAFSVFVHRQYDLLRGVTAQHGQDYLNNGIEESIKSMCCTLIGLEAVDDD